ncbi:DUF4145 domain-containing protein [Burkholderia vietnamiensis]|uniref:DUF4145 domain-containing protein n=1 Tax=Burkholderia vietnamiensis TaxID=60552 RepID=UPI001B981E65|nr:DUF4145 domain-containing protein [Burkholderia vietnamiensis]MBR8007401.1 DUF4145 domain-containing protein [Burkholderia vietnamiensis]
MERTPYMLPFTREHVPAWLCPICRSGHLRLLQDSLAERELSASRREHDHVDWEPDWIRGVFSCLFECNNEHCNEVVSCAGISKVAATEVLDDEYGWVQQQEEHFYPDFFTPSLVLMDIPKACPEAVRKHLQESFSLAHANAGAALNCARAGIEAVLTDLGVTRFKTQNGKRRIISLHQRIESLPSKYDEQKQLLLAVKWLGNAGSHAGLAPDVSDLRSAYDLLESVLAEVYDKKTLKLKAVAKKVNKKKGPAK